MSTDQLAAVLRHARDLVASQAVQDLPDRQLLERFSQQKDQAAFAALVQRHARLVWGVCRHGLHQEQDTEDAFQATFLVLALKAGSIRTMALGSWLHGTAYRCAMQIKRKAARRRAHEQQAKTMSPATTQNDTGCQELQSVLDQEVQGLPENFRAPFVLCCLEGKSRAEAARELGWKEGTVSGRLARARHQLQQRLLRRGISLSATLCASALSHQAASAAVPAVLKHTTVRAGFLLATRPAEMAAVVSVRVAAIVQGVTRAMFITKAKVVLVCLLTAGLAGAGVLAIRVSAAPLPQAQPTEPAQPPAEIARRAQPREGQPLLTDRLGDPLPPGALARLGTVRFRHGEGISSLMFLPGGKGLVSAGYDNVIRVWEVATGKPMARFRGHYSCVTSLALSPDGRILASGGNDNTIHLWDLVTGTERQRIVGHRKGGLCVAFSPDGKMLASGSHDQNIILWDVATGKPSRAPLDTKAEVTAVTFLPDGKSLISAGGNGSIQVWDTASGERLRQLHGHDGKVWSVVIGPDGTTPISTGEDKTFRVWNLATGTALVKVSGSELGSLTLSPDGKTFATTATSGVGLWEVGTGKFIGWVGEEGHVSALAFSPDGKTLATGLGNAIRLWEVGSGKEVHPTKEHFAPLTRVAFSPDGNLLATAGDDGAIRLWRAGSEEAVAVFQGHKFQVRDLAFSPNGKQLVSAGQDRTVRIWDVATGKKLRQLSGHHEAVTGIAFSPDGKVLASCSFDQIRWWRTTTFEDLGQIQAPPQDSFCSLAFSPDGGTLASGNWKSISLWKVTTGEELGRWRLLAPEDEVLQPGQSKGYGYLAGVHSLCFSPDGRFLTSASRSGANLQEFADRRVRHWNVATQKEWKQFTGHQSEVTAVAFSPVGKTVASASADGTIRLWEMTTGKERRRFVGHQGLVVSLAFSPDGKNLASASADTTALVWDLTGRVTKAHGATLPPTP